MRRSLISLLMLTFIMSSGLFGCATIRTMPNMGIHGSPKVFSGVQLDYNAATANMAALSNIKAEAPDHPLLDLPFSAVLDLIIIPVTVSIATYELLFE